MSDCELTILLPCLNEAETLALCIREAKAFIEAEGIAAEVLIADNGSVDSSREIAEREGARVVDVEIRGYGAAIYFGTQAARGGLIIMGDSDGSYDLAALRPIFEALRGGADIVMGNRFTGQILPGAMPWKNRYLGNPILSLIGRFLFGVRVGDFHCGLRGYRRDTFFRWDLQTTGMEFASEMVIKAQLMNSKIAEVPIVLRPDGRSRPPHLRPWRDGWRHLRLLLLYSPNWLFVVPGIICATVGAVGIITALIVPENFTWLNNAVMQPLTLQPTTLQPTTSNIAVHTASQIALVEMMGVLMLVGTQTTLFGGFLLVYSLVSGFRPLNPSLTKLFNKISLEWGLAASLVVLVVAVGGLFYALNGASGTLTGNSMQEAKLTTAAFFLLLLGFQIAISSLFFSVLGIGLRKSANPLKPLVRR